MDDLFYSPSLCEVTVSATEYQTSAYLHLYSFNHQWSIRQYQFIG